MNKKTTIALLVLVVAVGLGWAAWSVFLTRAFEKPPDVLNEDVRDALEKDKTKQPVTIVIQHGGDKVELFRKAGESQWKSASGWPMRPAEVRHLLAELTGLQTRFLPMPITRKNSKEYGLDDPAVIVDIRVGDTKQTLDFGSKKSATNSYYQETYVRRDSDKSQAIRLAPGIIESLSHPLKYYQQRWLFLPPETKIKETAGPANSSPTEVVKAVHFVQTGASPTDYSLAWSGSRWDLIQPVHDRVDPDRLHALLTAIPDIWVDFFEDRPEKDLAKYGLDKPERTLQVTGADGTTLTLLIGKQSPRKGTRTQTIPSPPSQFGQPTPPRRIQIPVNYRYAKLQGSKDQTRQVFEIQADNIDRLTVPVADLRDPRLARFQSADARKLDITWAGKALQFSKDKTTWKLVKPVSQEVDSSKVTELLDKLSQLQAQGADVIDNAKPAAYGLDRPAGSIRVTVEEVGKDKAKTKHSKVIRFALGKDNAGKGKLYVRVGDGERINAVEDNLLKLVRRPALAYRSRKVLDFSTADLARIDIHQPKDSFTLEQVKDTWRLKAPVQADVEAYLANQLAGDLSRLEAVEFVADSAKPADLDKRYGLGKSALTAKVTFSSAKKKPQTLLVGKQRAGKPEIYAKLADEPAIFVVKKELHDTLEKSSLAYRPPQLWQMQPDQIAELDIHKGSADYQLKRDGQEWRITGPFAAAAGAELVQPLVDEMASLRCERYEAHFAKKLGDYGLDKPYLRITVTPKKEDKKKDKQLPGVPETKELKEHVLLVGKPVDKNGKARFAKLGENEAVFVLGDKSVAALDRGALDLLERNLLKVDPQTVQKVNRAGTVKQSWTLQRKKDAWQVVASPAGAFAADADAAKAMLGTWANLQAARFAAYGPKANLADFGLKTPAVTITLTTQKADKKASQHTLALGKPVPGAPGEHYARLDQGPGVVVLDAATVRQVSPGYLELVNRSALHLDAAAVTALKRQMGKEALEIVRQGETWQLQGPPKQTADKPTLDALVGELAGLRASRVAGYPVSDLKPYGLDKPLTIITLRLIGKDKKAVEHVIRIGGPAKAKAGSAGERFAQVDQSKAVIVLPGALVKQLSGAPLHFRDHNLAHLPGADRVEVDRGGRKAVFAKVDDAWKMTKPVEADAEQADLEDFLKSLGNLRADDLVDGKGANLKDYGLDRPEAAWRFYAGDKEVLGLLVGAHEKVKKGGKETEGPRCYAKLAKGDLVFLLSPQLTARTLGEYRSRAVWSPAPDAAQVDELRYNYRQKPFVLTKVANDWQVADMPAAKVKSAAVRAALDALAGLKAARYVSDKGSDLELYGLKQPTLVLEVKSRTGTQTLEIGRPEGGSQRVYARVGGKEDNPVFVIAETDATRIVRTLKDLTEVATKK